MTEPANSESPPRRGVPLLPQHMVRAATLTTVGTRFRVVNWRGDPWPGALLWPVQPGTSTPKPTYTDDTYSTPNPWRLAADADGFFPQMHAPEGEVFDLILSTPSGETLLRFEAEPAQPPPGEAA